MTLLGLYFCIISIFLWGSGVSHTKTVHLIVSLSKETVLVSHVPRGELTAASEMFWKLLPGYHNSSKIHNVNKS